MVNLEKIKPGQKIKVSTQKQDFEGIVMPSEDPNTLFIKLNSGYNTGIKKNKIKKIKTLKTTKKTVTLKSAKIKTNKSLPTISILHTGGTIASKVDYSTGAVFAKFKPEDLLEMFPELKDIAQIRSRLVRNMWSDDMRFDHYNLLAKEVQKEVQQGVDAVIITHGTDTLHFSSAALAFILKNPPIPILLVGAQRSSDRGSSDAFLNLICAAQFITKSDFAGVALCMHSSMADNTCSILSPTKVRKMHASRRDAFRPINTSPIALVAKQGKIDFKTKDYLKKDQNKNKAKSAQLNLELFNPKLKIGLIKARPQMFSEEFEAYKKFDGLILEGTGLGHFPISKIDEFTQEHKSIFKQLRELAQKMPVVMSSQTIFGRINMNVYSPGRELLKTGVLGNLHDMTPETTFIKLAWLLSNYSAKEIKEKNLINQNFRGEITKCSEPEEDFLEN